MWDEFEKWIAEGKEGRKAPGVLDSKGESRGTRATTDGASRDVELSAFIAELRGLARKLTAYELLAELIGRLGLAPLPAESDSFNLARFKTFVDEWQKKAAAGEITEVFACGTAAVLTPVGRVKSRSAEWLIGDGTPGPVTLRLREELIAIQYGHRPDPFGWVHKVC